MDPTTDWPVFEGALTVKLEIFEGPLDLLLHLIRSSKLDIYDIPVAEITGQYLEYLEIMKDLNLDIASEFLLMAATLMHIKSRMLLPATEESEDEDDPRAELVQQLLEYQRFKEASEKLKEMQERRSLVYPRDPEGAPEPQQEYFLDVSLFHLLQVLRDVISRSEEGPGIVVAGERFSVVDKMRELAELLDDGDELVFRDLFPEGTCRAEVVATFLALLELIRMRMVHVSQAAGNGEIIIRKAAA